jgi:hypothetical protein
MRKLEEWPERTREILDRSLELEEPNPELGALWSELRLDMRDPPTPEELQRLLTRGRLGERALYAWIAGLASKPQHDAFVSFVSRNSDWLGGNTFTWGTVAYAWAHTRLWKAALPWVTTWRSRSDAQSWMLVNVAEILRSNGRDAEAADVSRHGITMPEERPAALHGVLLATDALRAGRFDEARTLAAGIDRSFPDADYLFLLEFVDDLLEVESIRADERREVFRSLKDRIRKRVAGYEALRHEPSRQRYYVDFLRLIPRLVPGVTPRLWCWGRRLAALFG